ncbi:cysteine-rich receptor-like protein kinase [Tanacetum coccineum]
MKLFSLANATEARFTDLQLWKLLRSNPTTLGEAFFKARIIEARFEDEQSTTAIAKPNDLNTGVQVQDLEKTIRHKPNKKKMTPNHQFSPTHFGSNGGNDSETSGPKTHAKEVVDNGNGSALTFLVGYGGPRALQLWKKIGIGDVLGLMDSGGAHNFAQPNAGTGNNESEDKKVERDAEREGKPIILATFGSDREKDDAKPPIFTDTFGSNGGNDSETSGPETPAKEVVDNAFRKLPGPLFHSPLFRKLSTTDAIFLESEISMEEVKAAVWSCLGSKSPGPDGFNFNFIKAYWEVLRFDFYECVKHFKATGKLANGCNPSFIVLIPKKCDPLGFSDYRPISLNGCVYKVISKILALRLAKVISSIIGPNQTAFLAGRQILDGCLIANEIIRMEKIENQNLLLFKVDFEKAFDCVNWRFLHDMRQMGFRVRWRNWIDACLSFTSTSVLVNGSPSTEFKMERGLRQGFYKGVYLSEDGSNVSLLQYADDALFFGKWSRSNTRNLILILKCFKEASAPLKIIKLLESLRCRFFWGFNEDHHGISWVKWDSILVSPRTWSLRMVLILVKMFGFQMYPALMDLSRALGARFFPGIANRHKMKGSSLDDISSLTSHIGNFTLFDGDDKWVWKDDASSNFKESIDHYLISCSVVVPIWRKVWAWWGLDPSVSFSSFSISDISLAIIGFPNNPVLSKILHGGFQCVIWAIWKWRNKVVNASFASLIDAKNEDIFPSIQRLSKLWIAARCNRLSLKWTYWISSPSSLLDSG